jgi:Mg-chelatase subunit ChlD
MTTTRKCNELEQAKKAIERLNNDTELVFIIDRSGSMSGLVSDTIGGFNSMIEKQRNGEGRVYVSTVLFNSESEIIHDRVPIEEVRDMTENDYDPSGTTALLDAIGGAIRHVSNIHKYARPEDVPSSTVFVITTDGMENSSREYSRHEVKRMIEEKTESYGWEFIFVAANIDEVETARSFGIRKERAAKYSHDGDGVLACYRAMNEFVSMKRDRVISDSDETWKLGLD